MLSDRLTRIDQLSAQERNLDYLNALIARVNRPIQVFKPYEPDFVMLPPPKFLADDQVPRKPVNYRKYFTAGLAFAVSFMFLFCNIVLALALVKPS